MKTLKKAFNIVGNVMICVISAIVLTVLILFFCGIRMYVTLSGSMEPAIQTGSICFVDTRADYNDIREGDIIAYKTELGDLVTHRAIAISENGIVTKGDSNNISDGYSTDPDNFHGKTLFSIPCIGYFVLFLQEPKNILILLVILAATYASFKRIGCSAEEEEKLPAERADEISQDV